MNFPFIKPKAVTSFLAIALNEPEKPQIIKLTAGHELIAPEVLPFEIENALTSLMKLHILDVIKVITAWDATQSIQSEL